MTLKLTFQRKLRLLLLGAASLTMGAANPGLSQAEKRAYARDLAAGLRDAVMTDAERRQIMGPLIQARLIGPSPSVRRSEVNSSPRSLASISNARLKLIRLQEHLASKYHIKLPVSTGVNLFEDEKLRRPPVFQSWLWLRMYNDLSFQPVARQVFQTIADDPRTLTWTKPVRIAATGNSTYDIAVAAAVEHLRKLDPGLPLDDRSFPNRPEEANVFVNGPGFQCPESSPCRPIMVTEPLAVAEKVSLAPISDELWLYPLVFFDQVHGSEWKATAPIYRLAAYNGYLPSAAWLRTDGTGHVQTAYCDRVLGPGTGLRNNGHGGTETEAVADVTHAVEICLAAAMGAASHADSGSLSRPNVREARPVDQIKALRILYSGRK
jgi:hypothetical protein